MQVRHIEHQQLDLARTDKTELQAPPVVQDEKPWEEVLQYLAVLAAIHMQPCHAAAERKEAEKKEAGPDDGEEE